MVNCFFINKVYSKKYQSINNRGGKTAVIADFLTLTSSVGNATVESRF